MRSALKKRGSIMPTISTSIDNLGLRFATKKDIQTIHNLILALATYEKRPEDMTATIESLSDALFRRGYAEVLLAEYNGAVVGYSLFYPILGSFSGKVNLYLEDLFILPEYRGKGFGKEVLRQLSKLALRRGWNSLHWSCLDWNQPSIDFYLRIGAKKDEGHVGFVLTGETMKSFVGE